MYYIEINSFIDLYQKIFLKKGGVIIWNGIGGQQLLQQ